MTHNNEVALMRGQRIAVLGLHRSVRVFDVRDARFFPVEPFDEAARELAADAVALYSGADRLYRSGAYRLDTPPPAPLLAAVHPAAGAGG